MEGADSSPVPRRAAPVSASTKATLRSGPHIGDEIIWNRDDPAALQA